MSYSIDYWFQISKFLYIYIKLATKTRTVCKIWQIVCIFHISTYFSSKQQQLFQICNIFVVYREIERTNSRWIFSKLTLTRLNDNMSQNWQNTNFLYRWIEFSIRNFFSKRLSFSRNSIRKFFHFHFLSRIYFVVQQEFFRSKYSILSTIHVIVRNNCENKIRIECETCIVDVIIFHIVYQFVITFICSLIKMNRQIDRWTKKSLKNWKKKKTNI